MRAISSLVCALVVTPAVRVQAAEPPGSQPASQPAVVEGIVLDHFGGGVPGASVRLEQADPPGAKVAEATTNHTGDFKLRPTTMPAGKLRVVIHKRGFVDAVQEIESDPDEGLPYVDVVLEGSATLAGTVTATITGKPVAGAQVACENGGQSQQAVTDAAGRFRIPGVVRGRARLLVRADGFALREELVTIDSDSVKVAVKLGPQRIVELLLVTPDSKPAAGVMIEALAEPGQQYLTAMSDAAGRAVIRGVSAEASALRLRLSGDGYVRSSGFDEEVQLPASQPASQPGATLPPPVRERVVVEPAATLRGTVVDGASGKPIVGVRIVSGRQLRSTMPMIWTRLDGTYELGGLPGGLNIISCQHANYATQVHEVQLAASQPAMLDLRLDAGQPVSGKVVDEAGNGLTEVWISAEDWKGYGTLALRGVSGADGSFLFEHAPAGEITFNFRRDGYAAATQLLSSGKTDAKVVLKAREGGEPGPEGGEKLAVGQAAPELVLTATDGTAYKLSALRGKYVFLDCWASWCGPCTAEFPHVRALRQATRGRADFLLLGLSLDQDEAAFKKAVAAQAMDWPQVFGPASGAVEAFDVLDGYAIPYTCLIGPDGKLIAQRLRGPGLVEQVTKVLPK